MDARQWLEITRRTIITIVDCQKFLQTKNNKKRGEIE
jgi:hypothetical protein